MKEQISTIWGTKEKDSLNCPFVGHFV